MNPNEPRSDMDIISIIGLLISLKNLDLNISQEDFQRTANILDSRINKHLQTQDDKLDYIISSLDHITELLEGLQHE